MDAILGHYVRAQGCITVDLRTPERKMEWHRVSLNREERRGGQETRLTGKTGPAHMVKG